VQRQDQHGVVGDLEVLGRHRHALAGDLLHLLEEVPGIDHHAVADDRQLALAHHARGQQRELVGLVADDQRMAGIVAALEAHHDLGALAQPVHDLALALVAPLGADHCHVGHCDSPQTRNASPRPVPGGVSSLSTLGRRDEGEKPAATCALPATLAPHEQTILALMLVAALSGCASSTQQAGCSCRRDGAQRPAGTAGRGRTAGPVAATPVR
jgi:hypothetical protein